MTELQDLSAVALERAVGSQYAVNTQTNTYAIESTPPRIQIITFIPFGSGSVCTPHALACREPPLISFTPIIACCKSMASNDVATNKKDHQVATISMLAQAGASPQTRNHDSDNYNRESTDQESLHAHRTAVFSRLVVLV